MAGLPDGFVIDQGQPARSDHLPDGFVIDQPDQELHDVGEPAISWGQSEFSPGLPAVNEAADAISKSVGKAASNIPASAGRFAGNIAQAVMHPIDTIEGMGSL